MQSWRARIAISLVCLLLGILMVPQFRSQRIDPRLLAQSPFDQASYLSQIYTSNQASRSSLAQLQQELVRYEQNRSAGESNLISLIDDLQELRMINGEVDVAGPGVRVSITGAQNGVQVLQDLVNELRASGAEAIAVNGVRLITRSVIEQDDAGILRVDRQPIAGPTYLLEAIGDPSTLQTALERKSGVIELLQQEQQDKLAIKVTSHSEDRDLVHLPRTSLDVQWRYARPVKGN